MTFEPVQSKRDDRMKPTNPIPLALSMILAIGAALAVGCATNETNAQNQTQITENITPQEAFTLIQNNRHNPDFVIIHILKEEEVFEEQLENAIFLYLNFETFRGELNSFDKNKTYLIYHSCACGDISGAALDIMAEEGFKKVYKISDGLEAWEAAGLPTIKATFP